MVCVVDVVLDRLEMVLMTRPVTLLVDMNVLGRFGTCVGRLLCLTWHSLYVRSMSVLHGRVLGFVRLDLLCRCLVVVRVVVRGRTVMSSLVCWLNLWIATLDGTLWSELYVMRMPRILLNALNGASPELVTTCSFLG